MVLLCIDGADLDDRIEPMVAAGELPTFRRLMEEGTWGSLATIEPTLSPVVWTTLATGRPPEEHGIYQFLYFRLPGMAGEIYHFPLHLGLNFRLFPRLEKLPGLSGLRSPYTSNMRRADALWDLVGRRYPVGIYRWLMTWPAEKVNGFSVAGGIAWAQYDEENRGEESTDPPDLPRYRSRRWREVTAGELAAFGFGGGFQPRARPGSPTEDDSASVGGSHGGGIATPDGGLRRALHGGRLLSGG